jgi:sarcosine oxidase delta subunit
MIERPLDFSYDACWLECPECGDRVVMSFEGQAHGEARTCRSGHQVSAQEESPALTDPFDTAMDPAGIERLVWYHTSTRSDWPPTDDSPRAKATHLGTFESAVENMFRRMDDEDDVDKQFFLHRVRIACRAEDASPVGIELGDIVGNVKLHVLYDKGYRVIRYVNVIEHPGSISLVVVPSVITHVQTLAVPLDLDVEESARAREAFATYTAESDAVSARRPSTNGISRLEFLKPRDPNTAPIVREARACDKALRSARQEYLQAMTTELMPAVGYRTHSKLVDALRDCNGVRYHDRFRSLADLVQNPARTVSAIRDQIVCEVGQPSSQR